MGSVSWIFLAFIQHAHSKQILENKSTWHESVSIKTSQFQCVYVCVCMCKHDWEYLWTGGSAESPRCLRRGDNWVWRCLGSCFCCHGDRLHIKHWPVFFLKGASKDRIRKTPTKTDTNAHKKTPFWWPGRDCAGVQCCPREIMGYMGATDPIRAWRRTG